jgi:Fe-S cluster biogenesis protein NfuA
MPLRQQLRIIGKKMTKNDIQEFIDDVINPGLAMHDGYVLVENFDENTNILKVQMGGGCQGCASSVTTLKLMIGNTLREEFPLLAGIEDITDHNAGTSPYYA